MKGLVSQGNRLNSKSFFDNTMWGDFSHLASVKTLETPGNYA